MQESTKSQLKRYSTRSSQWLSQFVKSDKYLLLFTGVVFLYLFLSGVIFSSNKYIPIKGVSTNVITTNDPIMVPNIADLAFIKTKNGPKKAPGDYSDSKDPIVKNPSGASTGGTVKNNLPRDSIFVFKGNSKARSPRVVIVTDLDYESVKPEILEKVLENRREYAKAHGYGLYIRYAQDFKDQYMDSSSKSPSWAKLPLMRAALHAFPNSKYIWYLDQQALIMNPLIDLDNDVLRPAKLASSILRGVPIVRNSDIIRTYKYSKIENIKLILTQDLIGLNPMSFVVKNDDFAQTLFDFWNDKLHRSYESFKQSDASALNHICQWHPAILSRVGVVPTRQLASFASVPQEHEKDSGNMVYKNGDFVVTFQDCEIDNQKCHREFLKYWKGRGRVAS